MSDDAAGQWTIDEAQGYATRLLSGEVCRLRGLHTADLDQLIAWRQSVPTDILQSDAVNPVSDARAREMILGMTSNPGSGDRRGFVVETLPDDRGATTLLGVVTLGQIRWQHRSAVFAIALDPSQGGHGYGRDAARVMVRYGFRELGLHRIELHAWSYNARAIATYRRAGFVEEGRMRECVFHDGRWHDEVVMSILATDPGAPR